MPEAILGLSCFYHDSAAALVVDGKIAAAAQEERFSRIKHDESFPTQAVEYCLNYAGLKPKDLKAVIYYDKPWTKFERLIETFIGVAPKGLDLYLKSVPRWLKERLWMRKLIDQNLDQYEGELLFSRHHESHAASAFYPSPFDQAAILTLDGVGEWHTTTWGVGDKNELHLQKKIDFPHSLGLLYSAFTAYTGFKVNSGEYKVMGLAPYGRPLYTSKILDEIIDLKEDGSFHLNMEYFDFHRRFKMTSKRFDQLFGGPPRVPESEISQKEMDLARSIQEVINMALIRIAKTIKKSTGQKNLCLAGGVSLNCVANGLLQREKIFDQIWIQPAAGDAGGALGAALFAWHQLYGNPRTPLANQKDFQSASRLGPSYSKEESLEQLSSFKPVYKEYQPSEIPQTISQYLEEGKVIGWFQGRMEFGPRALGGRSILGDPRSPDMQKTMNLKIKYRESFRPFAPSVLEEKAQKCFDMTGDSPYMLLVHPVHPERCVEMSPEDQEKFGIDLLNIQRSDLPSITHVDYSARVQTVNSQASPEYYSLIQAFEEKTGCPLLINTSFNVRGEPIVCRPEEAYRCFMRTEMDILVIDNLVFIKEEQPKWESNEDWKNEFSLD